MLILVPFLLLFASSAAMANGLDQNLLTFVQNAVPEGRIVSGTVTLLLLIALGIGRAGMGRRSVLRTIAETVSIGVAAAAAGVAIGTAIARAFGG